MILDYIRQKSLQKDPKITKSDIMKHIKDSRMMTTHKTTTELLDEGKIKPVKPKNKPDSKTVYLVLNEENEFNKIYNSLLEIEKIIDRFTDIGPETLRIRLASVYVISTKTLVEFLLVWIDTKIRSEKDALILYKKATSLMGKINRSPYHSHVWTDEINTSIQRAEMHKSSLTDEFIKVHPDANKWVHDIIDMLEIFKKRFLSETEQKTTKPREKSS